MCLSVERNCVGFEKTRKEVYAVNLLEYELVHKLSAVAELVYMTKEKTCVLHFGCGTCK